jgi:hypothetical protein
MYRGASNLRRAGSEVYADVSAGEIAFLWDCAVGFDAGRVNHSWRWNVLM